MESPLHNNASSQRSRLTERKHVVILHEKLIKRKSDRYILNLALAYHDIGYKVTLFTAQYNRKECIEDINFSDKIKVHYSGWWVPRSVLGLFRSKMSALKAAWMALKMALSPPEQKPTLIILDTSPVALYLLHTFTRYKLYYVATFEELKNSDACYEHSRYNATPLEEKWIRLADEFIVESQGFADIFKKSYPTTLKDPLVLYPSVDLGLWNEPGINIQQIIPDLLDNAILFLSIGKYRRSSNFQLAMDAFVLLLQIIGDEDLTKRLQLVVAGNCKTDEEVNHYKELMAIARERKCASQMTFLKQLPIIHEKTLISQSAIMIHPARNDVYSDFVLKAMSLGKPIVAAKKGIASKILVNRISGITTESEAAAVAQVMKKLMMSPHLQVFMGDIAKDAFRKNYSFNSLCEKLRIIMNIPATKKRSKELVLGSSVLDHRT